MDTTPPSIASPRRHDPLPSRLSVALSRVAIAPRRVSPGFLAAALIALAVWAATLAAQGRRGALTAAHLFDDSVLQRIDLQVNSRDWDTLRANYRENTYYPATMVWNGLTVRGAGIRSRGSGTRSASKPGLRVDFNRYADGQRFLGLGAIVLDNHLQDPSTLREAVAMKLFAKLSLPAPRESHAEVYLNGDFLGVYAIVEEVDTDAVDRMWPLPAEPGTAPGRVAVPRPRPSPGPMLPATGPALVSRDPEPFLYEYDWAFNWYGSYLGSDLDAYAEVFDPETYEDDPLGTHYEPFERLFFELNEVPDDQFVERVGARLDLENFIRIAAVQAFLAEWDGLFGAFGMNNFYVWREASGGPFRVIPWDADNTFFRVDYPLDAEFGNHVLARRALAQPELRQLFADTVGEAVRAAESRVVQADGSEASWLEAEIQRRFRLVAERVREDRATPNTPEAFEEHVAELLRFARGRGAFVRGELERLFGVTF